MGQSHLVLPSVTIALNGDLSSRTHDIKIAKNWRKLSLGLSVANTNVTGLSWDTYASVADTTPAGAGSFFRLRSRNIASGASTRYALVESVDGVVAGTDFTDLAEFDCRAWEWVRFIFTPTGTVDSGDVLTLEPVVADEVD